MGESGALPLFEGDLPISERHRFIQSKEIALDTETSGLDPADESLYLVQLCDRHGNCALVHHPSPNSSNLISVLSNPTTEFVIHFARFDLAFLWGRLRVLPERVVCTKIASRLVGKYDFRASLGPLVKEILGLELFKPKSLRISDWGANDLSREQIEYAKGDVLHLLNLWDHLCLELRSADKLELASKCFRAARLLAVADAAGAAKVEGLFEHH